MCVGGGGGTIFLTRFLRVSARRRGLQLKGSDRRPNGAVGGDAYMPHQAPRRPAAAPLRRFLLHCAAPARRNGGGRGMGFAFSRA